MLLHSKRTRHKRLGKWFTDTCVKRLVSKDVNSENTGAQGGFLVPPELQVGIDEFLAEENFFFNHATMQPMASKELNLPTIDPTTGASGLSPLAGGFTFTWVAGDSAAPTETELQFANLKLVARDLSGYSFISNQLVDDGGEPLGAYLETCIGRALDFILTFAFFNGLGTAAKQPLGLIYGPGTAVVTRNTTVVIKDADVQAMPKKLLPACWPHACWVVNPIAGAMLGTLTGFQPNTYMEEMGTGLMGALYGRPVYTSETLPLTTVATANRGDIVLFDPRCYVVGQRQEIEIAWTKDFPAAYLKNQSVVRVWWRGDGQPLFQSTFTTADGSTGMSTAVVLDNK